MHEYLAPMQRRLRLRQTVWVASRSAWVGVGGMALVLGLGRLVPIPLLWGWALVPMFLWGVWIAGVFFLSPQSPHRTALFLDRLLELRERLATAIEFHDAPEQSMLITLQRADAITVAQQLHPRQLPLQVHRNGLLLSASLLVLVIAMLMLPNPQQELLAHRQQIRQAIAKVNEQIEATKEHIARRDDLSAQERTALEQQLAALQEQLRRNPGHRAEALATLSATEQALRQRLDPRSDARRAAYERMAQKLDHRAGSRQASSSADLARAAQHLEELARQLEGMSQEERQQLAEQLAEQASQMASTDAQMAQTLLSTAQSLQQGDVAAAAQQLQRAAQRTLEARQELAAQEATEQSLARIQEGREHIARAGSRPQWSQTGQTGQTGRSGQSGQNSQTGQSGQSSQTGQAGQAGQSSQTGQSSQSGQSGQAGQSGQTGQAGQAGQSSQTGQAGQAGQSSQTGQSSQSGQSGQAGQSGQTGQAGQAGQAGQSGQTGQAGQAGQPGGGQGNARGNLIYSPFTPSGRMGEESFVPGQQGEGGSIQTRPGESSLPGTHQVSPLVPYEQVYPEYARSASEALERGSIPPHLKAYVRDYFARLGPAMGEE